MEWCSMKTKDKVNVQDIDLINKFFHGIVGNIIKTLTSLMIKDRSDI